eukprot:3715215-Lingulodinium_polyedra.AAC.1
MGLVARGTRGTGSGGTGCLWTAPCNWPRRPGTIAGCNSLCRQVCPNRDAQPVQASNLCASSWTHPCWPGGK